MSQVDPFCLSAPIDDPAFDHFGVGTTLAERTSLTCKDSSFLADQYYTRIRFASPLHPPTDRRKYPRKESSIESLEGFFLFIECAYNDRRLLIPKKWSREDYSEFPRVSYLAVVHLLYC